MFDWSDRFIRGFVGGLVAGIFKDLLNLSLYFLRLSSLKYSDFMGIMLYGHKPNNIAEGIFAWGAEVMFAGFAGVLISYSFLGIKSKNYVLKGWATGVGIYFAAYFITALFKVSGLTVIPFRTVVSNFLGSSVYGIILGLMLHWIDKRVEVEEKGVSKARIRKYYFHPALAKKPEPDKRGLKSKLKGKY